MYTDPCLNQNVGNRRVFWATQIAACGSYTMCGRECALPGLEYEDIENPDPYPSHPIAPTDPHEGEFRTIKTEGWLQGLILNILNTRARNDLRCPTPAAVYGHWSESYRDDDLYIGSIMWNAAEKAYVRISDSVRAVSVAVRTDMGKLIAMGLATSVEVEATYVGNNGVAVIVTVITATGRSVLNLSGSFVSETWVWH